MAKLYLELEVVQDVGLTRVHMVPSMLVRFISRAGNLSSLLEIPHLDVVPSHKYKSLAFIVNKLKYMAA